MKPRPSSYAALGLLALALVTTSSFGAATSVTAPMVCSRGPKGSTFNATVTMPASLPPGATFTVRVDSLPSGKISHTGLYYIYGMTTDFLVPKGTTYVEGSVGIVPDTGTENVRKGAVAWHDAAGIHMALPAHVENGSSYTPPSLEFSAKLDSPVGTEIAFQFAHYEVTAHAVLVGDVQTSCDPDPKPFTIDTLRVAAAAQ